MELEQLHLWAKWLELQREKIITALQLEVEEHIGVREGVCSNGEGKSG